MQAHWPEYMLWETKKSFVCNPVGYLHSPLLKTKLGQFETIIVPNVLKMTLMNKKEYEKILVPWLLSLCINSWEISGMSVFSVCLLIEMSDTCLLTIIFTFIPSIMNTSGDILVHKGPGGENLAGIYIYRVSPLLCRKVAAYSSC